MKQCDPLTVLASPYGCLYARLSSTLRGQPLAECYSNGPIRSRATASDVRTAFHYNPSSSSLLCSLLHPPSSVLVLAIDLTIVVAWSSTDATTSVPHICSTFSAAEAKGMPPFRTAESDRPHKRQPTVSTACDFCRRRKVSSAARMQPFITVPRVVAV